MLSLIPGDRLPGDKLPQFSNYQLSRKGVGFQTKGRFNPTNVDEGSGPVHMFVARIAHMQLESFD
jgi:hypothetical protein